MFKIRAVLLLILLLIGHHSIAQTCKYDQNEKDPFTGRLSAYIYIKSINDFSNVDVIVGIHNDSLYLSFNATYGQILEENPTDSGGVLLLKLSNDSIIRLNIIPGRLTYINNSKIISSTFSFGASLRKYDISNLSSNMISVIRFTSRKADWTYYVKKDKGKKIQKAIDCIKILQKN